MLRNKNTAILAAIVFCFFSTPTAYAKSGHAFGLRAGLGQDPDQFVVGAFAVMGRFGPQARVVPSVDIGFGDNATTTTLNLDLRWYLISLPESGVKLYGSAGPTLAFNSGDKGGSDSELGLSLTAGARIPMRGAKRYNIEARFGFGDIPDFRIMFGVLFGK
ncbi:MAG: hypothetical protein IIB00_09380 [candidate division Zixibacteria bacterium]|nr:hypothetical protein [candidate division Zixibacteria bacterium]